MRFSLILFSIPLLAAADNVCPVTKPPSPAFIPPAPYEVNAGLDAFWYGSNDLWTLLPTAGTWRGLPFHENKGYGNKLFLWQQGYNVKNEPKPDITVIERRFNGPAPIHTSQFGTNAFFSGTWKMLTGVSFATAGCWEVSATHDGHKLTFIISIEP